MPTSAAASSPRGSRNTPASRRAVRIAAAKALVVLNDRLGDETDPKIRDLARQSS